MEIKKIVEGMTAKEVSGVIDHNFGEIVSGKADKSYVDEKLKNIVSGSVSGYKYLTSTDELPTEQTTIGYIIGNDMYLYVGEGGNTLGGLYQNVGPFKGEKGDTGERGADGLQGEKGEKGEDGEPGITSAIISIDDTTGIPSASVSIENQVLNISLSGLKGEQGNSGYQGAAGELEVVNSLTQGGSTSALSAEMGKYLNNMLYTPTGSSGEPEKVEVSSWYEGQYIASNGGVSTASNYAITRTPIFLNKGETLTVTAKVNGVSVISKVITLNQEYKPLVTEMNNSSLSEKTYTYTADESIQVMVTVKLSEPYGIYVTKAAYEPRFKVIEKRITTIESEQSMSNEEIQSIKGELYKSVNVDFSALDKVNTFPNGTNTWKTDLGYSSYIIEVIPNTKINVVAHPTQSSYICFLKNLDGYLTNGASVNYATGFSGSGLKMAAGEEVDVTAPSDALFLLAIAYTTTDITPQSVTILERRTVDVVNNLTDGGSRKALSAEMGKEIGNILFKEVADEDQVQDVTPTTWYDGQYIQPNGVVGNSQNYAVSREPISLLTGDMLEITTSVNNVTVLAKVITLGQEYIPLVTETSNNNVVQKTYTYTAQEPISVVVIVKKTAPYSVVLKKTKNINRIEYIEQELNNLLSSSNGGINTINLKKTDYISTTRNYILREIDENGIKYFMYSKDLGITWTKTENIIGDIQFVHWFSDGICLVCGVNKAYTTKDFVSFDESSVYDKDGNVFTTTTRTFFRLGNYNSEYRTLNGREVLVWNDYGTEGGYVSRVWFTDDYGKTIKCLLKGNEMGVRHFHRTLLFDNAIWITSGDDGTQCKLIKGELNEGSWVFNVIGQGNEYKLGQLNIVHPYAVFITDYTDGQRPTGMVKCPIDKLNDASNFEYIFKIEGNPPVSSYWEDSVGNRVILPDGIGYKKLWFAKKNCKFSKVDIVCDDNIAPMTLIGPNYNGECTVIGVAGYDAASSLHLNDKRYMISDAMKEAGITDFGFMSELFNQK